MAANNQKMVFEIENLCKKAKNAADILSGIDDAQKNDALLQMATQIEAAEDEILTVNENEVNQAIDKHIYPAPFIDRLRLNRQRLTAMVHSLQQIAQLKDPVG